MVVRCTAVVCALALIGCKTTYSVTRQDEHRAQFRITSEPTGATAYVGDNAVGKTPTAVTIPYVETEKEVHPGKPKTGWVLLVTGLVGLAAGAGMTYWGITALDVDGDSTDYSTGKTMAVSLGLSLGPLAALYGLFGAAAGGYMISSSDPIPNQIETEPREVVVSLNVPGEGIRRARLSPKDAARATRLTELERLHYSADSGTWSTNGLPSSLRLVGFGKRRENRQKPSPQPRARPKRENPGRTIIAVFNIQDQGANLSRPMLIRLSDYLAMRLAATAAFQIIPRDELKKRLVEQKRGSYNQCYAQSCQIEIGKELAAQKSLSTAVARLGSKCVVTSVLYDLRKAASEGGASVGGGCSEDEIVATLEHVVQKLARRE